MTLDPLGHLGQCLLTGSGADDHSVPARLGSRFHDQRVEMTENVLTVVRVAAPPRRDIGEDRLLVEEIADDLGDERVERLVVCDTCPGALTIATVPARHAAMIPGTPMSDSGRNTWGSRYASSIRR